MFSDSGDSYRNYRACELVFQLKRSFIWFVWAKAHTKMHARQISLFNSAHYYNYHYHYTAMVMEILMSQASSGNRMSSTIQLTIPEINLDQTGDIFAVNQCSNYFPPKKETKPWPRNSTLFSGTYQCSVLRRCNPPPKEEEEPVAITKSLYMKVGGQCKQRTLGKS